MWINRDTWEGAEIEELALTDDEKMLDAFQSENWIIWVTNKSVKLFNQEKQKVEKQENLDNIEFMEHCDTHLALLASTDSLTVFDTNLDKRFIITLKDSEIRSFSIKSFNNTVFAAVLCFD